MTFINMLRDESGASAAEYALILAIVGTGIAAAALFLGGEVSRAMNGAGDRICADPDGADESICRDGATPAA
ncbi:Flp family type IVb pilin [Sphingomonas kaistensis]|uniref:Flp family type IVb pilin n=1 Tax=Sphingomonas kaistensis TaxID=298708 RepID=A0ABZ2G198_9SPHN